MKLIHKTITICGATILIGVMAPATFAQAQLPSKVQTQAVDYLNRGLDKVKQGDYTGAIADYTQAINANPKLTVAYISRGKAYHDLEQLNRVIADFEQALKLQPNSA